MSDNTNRIAALRMGREVARARNAERLAAETVDLPGGWRVQPAVGHSQAGRHVGWEVHAPDGHGGPWYTATRDGAMALYEARSRLQPRKKARTTPGPTDPTGHDDRAFFPNMGA
jgi:hypothetical protein